ncbi:MAG: hypothetical protein JNM26_16435, partial [Ideonella sp.]|nr:hypothetical protein [Ideonella sp.]
MDSTHAGEAASGRNKRPAHSRTENPDMAGGRPSAFREEYVEQVRKLCRLGATEEEIADFFSVSIQTTYNWRDAHPEFLEALRAGKMEADANVSDRLYSRALGYSHPEEKIFQSEG